MDNINNTIFDTIRLTPQQIQDQFNAEFLSIKGYVPNSGETWNILMSLMTVMTSTVIDQIITNNKNTVIQYASGAYLDFIGLKLGVPRYIQTYSTVYVKLIFTGGDSFTLYSGFEVKNEDGLSFFSTSNVIISSGQTMGTYLFTASLPGSSYNGIPINTLTIAVSSVPQVISVANTSISAGGIDLESDTDYRIRLESQQNYLSAAGNIQTYYVQLHENFPQVLNAYIPRQPIDPGVVQIYVILPGAVFSDSILKDSIIAYFRLYGPLTDTVQVLDPSVTTINVSMTVYNDGTSESDKELLEQNIKDYYNNTCIIGREFYISNIISMGMKTPLVTNVKTTNTDSAIGMTGVIQIGTVTISWVPSTP